MSGLIFSVLLTVLNLNAADFFISPTGNDANPGTKSKPFASLERARDAVRARKQLKPDEDYTVQLRGGTYPLKQTVVFSLEDSASTGHTITYTAYHHETPVISGGAPLRHWKHLKQDLDHLPASAHGKIWVADAPFPNGRIYTLYDGMERLPRARTEGFTPPEMVKPDQLYDHFEFPAGTMKNWPDLDQAELLNIPSCDYEMTILPIASVNEQTRVAVVGASPSRRIAKVKYMDKTLWVENIVEALDQPGEWIFDSVHRKIYLWPKGDRPSDKIVAPVTTELIRVEGKIDYKGPKDEPVTGLVFQGLTFMHAERLPWTGDSGYSLQHSWEFFDHPTAAVRFRGAARCEVRSCRFTATSGTGIRLDLTCQRNRVTGCEFSHVGWQAVLLCGYGAGTKDVNFENEVSNNWIHETGEVYWAGPAVMAWQSGRNHIANNLIHNTPYSGIAVNGRLSFNSENLAAEGARAVRPWELEGIKTSYDWSEWYAYEKFMHSRENLVENNNIHHVMEKMGDGNGIYISGCGRANHIYHNYIHDCTGQHMGAGIRCDDVQNETILEGNIVCRVHSVQTGVSVTGRNHIINNIIADIIPSVRPLTPPNIVHGYICVPSLYPYGTDNGQLDISGMRIERNIVYSPRPDYLPLLEYRSFSTGPGVRLKGTSTDHNLYWCPNDPKWGQRYLDEQQPLGVETGSLSVEPGFVNIAKDNFRLKADSPAWKLGFQPIDMSKIGLLPRHPFYRETVATIGRNR